MGLAWAGNDGEVCRAGSRQEEGGGREGGEERGDKPVPGPVTSPRLYQATVTTHQHTNSVKPSTL